MNGNSVESDHRLYRRVAMLRRYGSRRSKVIVKRYSRTWSAKMVLKMVRSQAAC